MRHVPAFCSIVLCFRMGQFMGRMSTLYSRDGFIEEVYLRRAFKGTLVEAYWSV